MQRRRAQRLQVIQPRMFAERDRCQRSVLDRDVEQSIRVFGGAYGAEILNKLIVRIPLMPKLLESYPFQEGKKPRLGINPNTGGYSADEHADHFFVPAGGTISIDGADLHPSAAMPVGCRHPAGYLASGCPQAASHGIDQANIVDLWQTVWTSDGSVPHPPTQNIKQDAGVIIAKSFRNSSIDCLSEMIWCIRKITQ
ncbi:hypothetical protein NLX82_19460 [Paenibacillus sp. A3M_27_13]|nr:hypothetical protein [Paenibacillus sp. A3M_27_13]MCP3746597.1 hypothetical protein [Paenibacillus sp. A3M_27_13]